MCFGDNTFYISLIVDLYFVLDQLFVDEIGEHV